MDSITGIYGGHHYINDRDLFDNSFYKYFHDKIKWGTDLAKTKNKRFIMGEFGAKQNSNIIDSVMHDANMYNHTPLEKYMCIQVSEAILALINAGSTHVDTGLSVISSRLTAGAQTSGDFTIGKSITIQPNLPITALAC